MESRARQTPSAAGRKKVSLLNLLWESSETFAWLKNTVAWRLHAHKSGLSCTPATRWSKIPLNQQQQRKSKVMEWRGWCTCRKSNIFPGLSFFILLACKFLHVFTHLPSSLQRTISTRVEKHPHYFHHGIFVHSQYPPCHASLKILDEVNWVIKTLQMGSWRSMIKKRVGPSLPHRLPPHPLYFRKPDNSDKKAG